MLYNSCFGWKFLAQYFISYNFMAMADNIVHDMVECYLAWMWNIHASLTSFLLSFFSPYVYIFG
jgi:hypothetical protein